LGPARIDDEAEIEIILEGGKEKHPDAKPRIISTTAAIHRQGLQGVHSDFGMTHVRTSPYYTIQRQIERWHKSLKRRMHSAGTPLTPEDARRLIQEYVDHYNTVRLHSAIGFVTPADMLAGRQAEIHAARIANWKRRASSAKNAGSRRPQPSEIQLTLPGETERLCRDATMLRDNLAGSSRRCCWGAEVRLSRSSPNRHRIA